MSNKKPIKTKTKEQMKEISDIVRNAETDEAALAFLKDALEDDFPDLELGTMNLHEASEVLMQSDRIKKEESDELTGDLGAMFGEFMKRSERNSSNNTKKNSKKKRRRSRRKKRK